MNGNGGCCESTSTSFVSGLLVLLRRKFSFLHLGVVLQYFALTSTFWKLKWVCLPGFLFVQILLFKLLVLAQAIQSYFIFLSLESDFSEEETIMIRCHFSAD